MNRITSRTSLAPRELLEELPGFYTKLMQSFGLGAVLGAFLFFVVASAAGAL